MALRLSRLLPSYTYSESTFFVSDEAPREVETKRREGFRRLELLFHDRFPKSIAITERLESGLPDLAFVNSHRVPFQYQKFVHEHLRLPAVVAETDGAQVRDMDGNWAYDLGGSYGVNLFGSDFYKQCIDRGVSRARNVGVVLGPYHPIVEDNIERLKAISGLDAVSFHMSGTEAVMQAVRLARYHTGRSHLVRFSGAYHGWWDAVQPGIGNPRPALETYTLREMHSDTLRVLQTRDDIACVLVNPIQALNPNGMPATDSTLIASDRSAHFDKVSYTGWLLELRKICTARGIVLIVDEVFLGFRLARGGAQEYFGVKADMVTYGKTLGGGFPIGVVCGRSDLMCRSKDDRPLDICFARGTFNSHPYVMATMNEFLCYLDTPEGVARYEGLDALWDKRAQDLNRQLEQLGLPVRFANLTSVWTTLYTHPSRYNWMLQYYLRAEGLTMSWIGTGRFIFSHALTDADFATIAERIVAAARSMNDDGWWWTDAALTNRAIKRRVTRELLSVSFGRVPLDPAIARAEATAAPCDTSSRREMDPSGSS